MGLISLLEVSLMPILQVLILCMLGAFMATDYLKLFPAQTRRALNRVITLNSSSFSSNLQYA